MLVLSRRLNEKICFPDVQLVIHVLAVKGGVVRLGIQAPPEVVAVRAEIQDRTVREQRPDQRQVAGQAQAPESDFLLRTICAGLGLAQLRLEIGRTRSLDVLLGMIHVRVLRLRRLLRPQGKTAAPVEFKPPRVNPLRLRRVAPILLAVVTAGLLTGCGGGPAEAGPGDSAATGVAHRGEAGAADAGRPDGQVEPPRAGGNQVVVDNFAFNPRTLTVTAGTTVTWLNRDDVPHTVTSAAEPRLFGSQALDTDEKFSHTFKTPGTYEYFCALHPRMTGKVIVKQGEPK